VEAPGGASDQGEGEIRRAAGPGVAAALMRLYVIRHATAEGPGEAGDVHRRLTPLGRWQAKEAGRALLNRGVGLGRLFSSPAARARETAELIAGELNPSPAVEILEALYSGPTLEGILCELQSSSEVALVGHLPAVEHFVRALISHPAELRFPPSTVCCVEFTGAPAQGEGRLVWRITP
jgi:phosphohistidine phosphatase